ncbi:MAG: amidohydrolase family protein [Acidobacteria bacterium]|nr:amidohydrolase family protein [Acidobacteriota bacterium]
MAGVLPTLARRALVLAVFCIAFSLAAPPAAAADTPHAPFKKSPSSSSVSSVDTLVTAAHVLTMDGTDRVFSPGAVAIKGGAIVAVGKPSDLLALYSPKQRILRPNAVVLPGLVNTHTHAAMNLLRGIADDLPLMDWLTKYIFPAEGKNVSPGFVRAGTLLACAEMVRGGTTTFADMYYFESDVASAVDQCGMRAVLGETWLDFPVPAHKDLPESISMTRAFLEKWKGHPRVIAAVAPHAPFTNSKESLLAARDLALEFKAPLLIHVSETKDEQKQIAEKYGTTPAKWLDSIGFLGPNVLAAHGVWLDADDMRLFAERRVGLAHNPESNMKLASGAAPVVAARKAGISVGLGTDGVAGSNNDLDMWEAMDFAGKLAKVSTMDPTALPAKDLLRMATIEGARAMKLDDRIGSLEAGKRADLVAVDLGKARTHPVWDLYSTLVYAAKESDVTLTMVEGRVLWNGIRVTTLDEAKVIRDAEEWRKKIAASLAPAGAK